LCSPHKHAERQRCHYFPITERNVRLIMYILQSQRRELVGVGLSDSRTPSLLHSSVGEYF
jgi:hypothetical protein